MKDNSQHESKTTTENREKPTGIDDGHGVVNVLIIIRRVHNQKAKK